MPPRSTLREDVAELKQEVAALLAASRAGPMRFTSSSLLTCPGAFAGVMLINRMALPLVVRRVTVHNVSLFPNPLVDSRDATLILPAALRMSSLDEADSKEGGFELPLRQFVPHPLSSDRRVRDYLHFPRGCPLLVDVDYEIPAQMPCPHRPPVVEFLLPTGGLVGQLAARFYTRLLGKMRADLRGLQ